jgi:MipA family protein
MRHSMLHTASCVLTVPVLMFALTALATDHGNANPSAPDNPEVNMPDLPLWEAGMVGVGVSHPAYPGSEDRVDRLLPLPYVMYRGKYLRIDRETVGVRAIKTPRAELDIGFGASLGSRAADIEARRGMDDLGTLVEFGPRLKINVGNGDAERRKSRIQFAARGVFDADDHLSYHGIAFEPQWVNEIDVADSWSTSTNIGALLGDQQLVDTFYRVTPAEATATRSAYDARSGLISLRASVFVSRLVGQDVRIFGYLRYDSLQGAANHDSPLVRSEFGWSVALGLAWTLAQSERSARD